MPDIPPQPVHFKEAIDFLKNKTNVPTRAWTDIWQGMHSRAFVVAGANRDDLVADFHDAVNTAIANGTTLADFRKDFDNIVAKYGWSYNGSRNWRSRVIFQTNLRTAYAAGKWEQAQRTKESRPYLRYAAVLDNRTRPEHRAWHGTILPVDDPWWSTHYPPNGWNCRCTVQTLSAEEVKANGWEVDSEAPPVDMQQETINTPDGPVTVDVPAGIDPGFGYNPGESAFGHGQELLAMDAHGDEWERLDAPGAPDYQLQELEAVAPPVQLATQTNGSRDQLKAALKRAIGGDEKVFDDPAGSSVLINDALVDHVLEDPNRVNSARERFWPLIPSLITDPQEVWIGFAQNTRTGQVALRRRYVSVYAFEKDRPQLLVADQQGGYWQGLTTFPTKERDLPNIRTGLRVYQRKR